MFALKTFPCPNCHEFINSGMEKCKYCSITIDPQMANAAVELQDKVNRSCNEASLLRNIAGAMWVGFVVRFVPFIGIVGLIIMVIGFIVVPRGSSTGRLSSAESKPLTSITNGLSEIGLALWFFGFCF